MASVTATSGDGVRTYGIYNEKPDPEHEGISIIGADITLQNVSLTATGGLASLWESYDDDPVSAGICSNRLNAIDSVVIGKNAETPGVFGPYRTQ